MLRMQRGLARARHHAAASHRVEHGECEAASQSVGFRRGPAHPWPTTPQPRCASDSRTARIAHELGVQEPRIARWCGVGGAEMTTLLSTGTAAAEASRLGASHHALRCD